VIDMPKEFNPSCPVPIGDQARVLMAHGGGGRLMHELIERVFLSSFRNAALEMRHDSAVVDVGGVRLAITTDSYVVHPLFCPGGDIGSIAVHGTINDLAMSGARPLYLSVGYIIEEGLLIETLSRVAHSMADAAAACSVQIVTGDTKVVDKGKGDGLFINTAGIGIIEHSLRIAPQSVRAGDAVLLSGDLGRHGIAVMAVREGLQFESEIKSDSASVFNLVADLIAGGVEVHCLRDLTRGGLATALNEIAVISKLSIEIDERVIPVCDEVRGACEILGLDPFYVACEGRMIAFVPGEQVDRAQSVLRKRPEGAGVVQIGRVAARPPGRVTLKSAIGTVRILDMLSGEQLPRIC
jgi:hydrogenase expression/formation protein HypE